jgi:hypothetical protein
MTGSIAGVEGEAQRQRTTTPISPSTDGELDVVGGAGTHPDELPRRVMTTHPAAVDAGTRLASGGAVEAKKYRTCGNDCIRPGSALEGTRLNAGPTKTTLVAEVRATRYFTGSSRRSGVERGWTPLSHEPCLTPASGSQPRRAPRLFAMAGT